MGKHWRWCVHYIILVGSILFATSFNATELLSFLILYFIKNKTEVGSCVNSKPFFTYCHENANGGNLAKCKLFILFKIAWTKMYDSSYKFLENNEAMTIKYNI